MLNITKTRMISLSLGICLIGFTQTTLSEIYKWQDKNGNLHFSDVPRAGAQKIKLQEPQSYSAPQVNIEEPIKKNKIDKQIKYEVVEITYPTNNLTIKNNTGIIETNIKIVPKLAASNMIQFYYNGMPSGSPQTLNLHKINNVYRGTHTISAKIIDKQGKIVAKTSTITFYMQRPLVNQNNNLRKKRGSQYVIAPRTQVVKQQ